MSTESPHLYPFSETPLDTIASSIDALHTTFLSGVTKPIAWRINQINKFRDAFSNPEQIEKFCAALYQDLGKSRSESLSCELNAIISECDEMISLLKKKKFGNNLLF